MEVVMFECSCGKKINHTQDGSMYLENVFDYKFHSVNMYKYIFYCEECAKKILIEAGIKNDIKFQVYRGSHYVKFVFKNFSIKVYFYGKKGRPIINIIRTAFSKIKKEFTGMKPS